MGALGRDGIFQFEGFRLDCNTRALFRRREDGTFVPVALGSRALDVLEVLLGHAGDLVSRDEFMAAVWPATAVEDTNLNVQVAALRRVLDDGRVSGNCIQMIPGRGYRFAVRVIRVESSTPLTSGEREPIARQPEARCSAVPSRSRITAPAVPPPERRRFWGGALATVAGGLCLLAIVSAASNCHPRQSRIASPLPRLSIVVLPFIDLNDDRDGQNLAEALTEDLTTELSRLSDIRVVSRNTAFTYRNQFVRTNQIGAQLGVRYVLEGSVRRAGSQLRVSAQLIDAETDTQLWAERFDRDTGDPSALQNEITSRIANTLGFELIAAEAVRPIEHPDALGYILRARATHLRPDSRDVFAEAIGLLEHALALDPQSIEAQTLLARSLVSRVLDGMTDSAPADLARAERLVDPAPAMILRSERQTSRSRA